MTRIQDPRICPVCSTLLKEVAPQVWRCGWCGWYGPETAAAEMEMAVKTYASVDLRPGAEAMMRTARVNMIGQDKEEVLDRLFGLRIPGLRRHVLDLAYDMAEAGEGKYLAPPTSRWGMVNGLTEVAQTYQTQDARHAVDVAALKILVASFRPFPYDPRALAPWRGPGAEKEHP